ncbi:MAG TPA: EAL domain-containing protein, partial [Acidimicrobiales bacterium]|nr:EAL domain-containing protein [Acidimicrobiales bacterium]
CMAFYVAEMGDDLHSRHQLEQDLRTALQQDQFFLLYQPIVDLETRAVVAVEALLRWDRPGRGTTLPSEFIASLEATGMIRPVGAWVLHEACQQATTWQHEGDPVRVSVNISARQLDQESVVEDVERALRVSGLDPALLLLELTESALMGDERDISQRLLTLRKTGVRVAVDDFGTGYSSFAHLQRFPLDVLKIDRSFVASVSASSEAAAVVRTLVHLAKVVGLRTVAEGVEDDLQLRFLIAEDVDSAQGFLFARPLTADELSCYLLASRSKEPLPASAGGLGA